MISGPKSGEPTTRVHYVYDAWNRLVAVKEDSSGSPGTPGDVIATYSYDGLNRRIEKAMGGSEQYVTHYYYNNQWQLFEERDMNWSQADQINQYVWGPGYVDSPIACLHDGNGDGDMNDWGATNVWPNVTDYVRFYTTDANHNVTGVIAEDGGIIANMDRYVYNSYGEALLRKEDWSNDPSLPYTDGPLYCGYFFDTETRLYQVRNRFYDPSLSTWINRDPAAADINLYRYCGNNPINATDPTGLWGKDVHVYMTSELAKMAGLKCYKQFAKDTNAPDEDWREPVQAFLRYEKGAYSAKMMAEVAIWHFPVSANGKVEPGSKAAWSLFNDYLMDLSKHKDDSIWQNATLWAIASGLHALQDSYSHAGTPVIAGVGHDHATLSLPGLKIPLGLKISALSSSADDTRIYWRQARAAGMVTWDAFLKLYDASPDLFTEDPHDIPIEDVYKVVNRRFPEPRDE
ncbi:MAG: RHS repeat-associated core domain-containing protein [Thermoguttaceae bacterium]